MERNSMVGGFWASWLASGSILVGNVRLSTNKEPDRIVNYQWRRISFENIVFM